MVVVAAVDGEPGSERVVAEGEALATAFDESLSVLFVHERKRNLDRVNEYMDVATNPEEADAIEFAEGVATELAADLTIPHEAIGRTGEPASEILEYTAEVDASYLVIGGRSQSPVGKALFGSVTQSVLLEAERPVLTIMNR